MELIDNWRKKHPESPLSRLAGAIGVSRKGLQKKAVTDASESDHAWKDRIVGILMEFPCYGYRRITAALKRAGQVANGKKIRRIMRATGLTQKRRKWKPRTTDSRHKLKTYPNLVKDLVVTRPKQVFVGDITYVRLAKGFCYVAIVLDIFTKKVVGWSIEEHMEASLCTDALELALEGGPPEYFHSDRGGQYCSKEHTDILTEAKVAISMADTGVSVDNPFAESFNRTLKVEEVYLKEYDTIDDARDSIKRFIEDMYNKKRLHSSIGYRPPEEFEAEYWRKNQPEVLSS
jgi:putative transposase